ncbi:acetyl-CoA acetyltransferase [soil metagenome]
MTVFFLGGAQSDFARNLAREKLELAELVREVTLECVQDARIDLRQVESIHVGNAFGELFTGQAQMGALPATMIPELDGIPASRHEGACASGSLAVLAASAEIEAGRYDCVLVVGAEQERNVPGDIAARHLGTAAWIGHEAEGARYVWPRMFSDITSAIEARSSGGPTRAHLAAIARKNFANAKKNPRAQSRGWSFGERAFEDDDEANPVVEGRVRRQDCGQVTDGVAAIVLASSRFAEAHARKIAASIDRYPRISGWGHRTAALSLAEKLRRGSGDPYLLPHLRGAITDAYRRAEIDGPFALGGIETHDCFTITEYLALDHLGITPPNEAHRAIEERVCEMGGRLPVNPSGGLIGLGHPVGATGVRMALDACRQVTGRAGENQVDGATRFATLNIGGSATTVVAFVWECERPS